MAGPLSSTLSSANSKAVSFNWLYKRLLTIPVQESTFSRRGFRPCEPLKQQRLERSGQSFLQGYHEALAADSFAQLLAGLNCVESEFRGFAFEGAAMGLTLIDSLRPWRKARLQSFLDGPGASHVYMIHVGVGWALARLPFFFHPDISRLDPLLRWLAIDGYGFHQGYFYPRRYADGLETQTRLIGYAPHAFDQGLGRSLWFIEGADVSRISEAINKFPSSRVPDLWSGVGLACAYAGSLDRHELLRLRKSAGPYAHHVAQGAAFAAKTRQRAGNQAAHTDSACELLCEMSSDDAAAITDLALVGLPPDGEEPQYEVWRRRIRNIFAERLRLQS